MKTRILLAVTMMCLGCFSVQAQVSNGNANTVEALIGSIPDLPSVSTLAALHYGDDGQTAAAIAVEKFHEKMEKVRDRYKEVKEASDEQGRAAITKGVDKNLRKDYGKSLDEIQNMSESELDNWGMGLADKQLKKMGLNKSAKQLATQGEMSEAEAQQLANQMAQSMTGMSMAEMQALASKMENMSEEEMAAYAQQSGMAERMAKNAGKMDAKAYSASAKKVTSMAEIQEEMNAIQKQWNYIDGIYVKEQEELAEKMRQIIVKYDAQMPSQSGKIRDYYSGAVLLTYHTKEEQAQVKRITLQCFSECYTLWRNFITKRQGILKTRLTDCIRLDELQAKQMELQGYGNRVAVSSAYIVFDEYWKVTNSVTELPDGAMPEYEEQPNS